MTKETLLARSCRVAFSAFVHDLGKLAERSAIFADDPGLQIQEQLYCPRHEAGGKIWYTHKHAAHTSLALDKIESHCPDLVRGDISPFASRSAGENITDSLANAAAAHHRPATFLQWIIATADRVASGFEREEFDKYNEAEEGTATGRNHYQARQLTLFEQYQQDHVKPGSLRFRYRLAPMTAESIFPVERDGYEPLDNKTAQAEYRALWQAFESALGRIPRSHRNNWALWLDHFDTAWLTFSHAIPAATAFNVKPEVSLYDHSKTTAALAVALWRWHEARGDTGEEAAIRLRGRDDWDEKKFLLIQGDFFGIQDFIFADGAHTQKYAHKLLRGRSFQVSLLAECAALRLMDALQLPPTSQVINAAGKFLIVAPNNAETHAALERVRSDLDHWCIRHTFGEIGIGLASTEASCNDFIGGRFAALVNNLFMQLDNAKHQRFDLCANDAPTVLTDADFTHGPCALHGRLPADKPEPDGEKFTCALSRDQKAVGERLTKGARILVGKDLGTVGGHQRLELDYFGWQIAFVQDEDAQGRFGELAASGSLARCWDFDLPEEDGTLYRGYARRFVNSYVPRFDSADHQTSSKYGQLENEAEFDSAHPIKTLGHIACEDQLPDNSQANTWHGAIALATLKGDIDNLGAMFQHGVGAPSFAKWAALSRQVNAFFAIWLPWHCGKEAENTYTVFAGGDDFFLIGPWHSTIRLASVMNRKFAAYVAENKALHFSAGIVMTHSKAPARHLAHAAEIALDKAKHHVSDDGKVKKNAVSLWGSTVFWEDFNILTGARLDALQGLAEQGNFSTGLLYSFLLLSDQAQAEKTGRRPEDSLWRSRLAYRIARLLSGKERAALRDQTQREVGQALTRWRGAYRIPVSMHLYRQRRRGQQ